METLKWKHVDRKRSNKISHTDPEFVKGYDIDMADFTALVGKYNAKALTYKEECRLSDYVMTMMNIVLENPKVNPRGEEEMEGVTDLMFMDGWGALSHIKDGAKPYSYIYRSMYIAVLRYYKKRYSDRKREEQLESWIDDVYAEYLESVGTGKTSVRKTYDTDRSYGGQR